MKPKTARKTPTPKIFGAGLVALDIVVSAEPTTPVRAWAGGTCGNVLAILGFLGWDSFPIARLNDEPTAQRLKADLRRWGVHLDYVACEPTSDAPIIVQEIRRGKNGLPSHRFRWACLQCGHWLPSYRSITLSAAALINERVSDASVFFLDRLSPATVQLASRAAQAGALVVFEPSAKADPRLMELALATSHVLKYADQRTSFDTSRRPSPSVILEVKTMGARGLAYRSWLPNAQTRGWVQLPPVTAAKMADTCGSGDWCTAGLIQQLGAQGVAGLSEVSGSGLRDALRYAEALAAWNCGFEGARGGMYSVSRKTFEKQISQLLAGESSSLVPRRGAKKEANPVIGCPACSVAS